MLPAMAPNVDFDEEAWEVKSTAQWILSRCYQRIALQLPDNLLPVCPALVFALQQLLGSNKRIYVLGDTSYNPLGVDEVAAQHMAADCVVHYGRASLVPVTNLPVLFVLPRAAINCSSAASALHDSLQEASAATTAGEPPLAAVVLVDQMYQHALPQLQQELLTSTRYTQGSLPVIFAKAVSKSLEPSQPAIVALYCPAQQALTAVVATVAVAALTDMLGLPQDPTRLTSQYAHVDVPHRQEDTPSAQGPSSAASCLLHLPAGAHRGGCPCHSATSRPVQAALPVSGTSPLPCESSQEGQTVVCSSGSQPDFVLGRGSTNGDNNINRNSCCNHAVCTGSAEGNGSGDTTPIPSGSSDAYGIHHAGTCCGDGRTPAHSANADIVGGAAIRSSGSVEASVSGSSVGLCWTLPPGVPQSRCLMLWLGAFDAPGLQVLQLTHSDLAWSAYDPAGKAHHRGILPETTRLLKRRYYLVEKAREASIVGILVRRVGHHHPHEHLKDKEVGTLATAGFVDVVDRIRQLAQKAGKKTYTLLMGKPNPAKLANFPEVEVFVMVADPQGLLLNCRDYLAPVITPFEAELAFRGLSLSPKYYSLDFDYHLEGMRTEGLDSEDADTGHQQLQLSSVAQQVSRRDNHSMAVAACDAADYLLNKRTHKGLETPLTGAGPAALSLAVAGRSGRAAAYTNEPARG